MKKVHPVLASLVAASLLFALPLSLQASEAKSDPTTKESASEEHHDGEESHEHHDGDCCDHHDGDEDHDHHDGDKDHDHHDGDCCDHHAAEARYEGDVAYWGIYDLKAGEYFLQFGHTHEKHFKAVILPTDKAEMNDTLLGKAKELMKTEGEAVKQKATVQPAEDKAYNIEMGHMSGQVTVKIEKDGKYVLFGNSDPDNDGALPYWMTDAEENELKPVKEETLDDSKSQIYHGYFKDEMVKDRALSEWKGEWKSVYPFLKDGSLDKVMEAKAKTGKMSAEEYKKYYDTGYKTDVDAIKIDGDQMTFTRGDKSVTAKYKYDGFKILKYEKGNRGVRYLFSRVDEVEGAPKSVQFSDHNIAPSEPAHFHLFFGDQSHEELLKEMEHWPTYYPQKYTAEEIQADMLAH